MLVAPVLESLAAERIGRASGLPLPRYAALKDDRVNMRRGPGTAYAIQWELRRRHMPVRIIAEHGHWRRVELPDGDRGWIHRVLLTTKRYAVIRETSAELYDDPADDARLLARIEAETPIRLLECTLDWCRGEIDGQRGWTPKRSLWGVAPTDVFD